MQQNEKHRTKKQGSRYWIQKIINSEMKNSLEDSIGEGKIAWLSPLKDDKNEEYKEYQLSWKPIDNIFGFTKDTFLPWWSFSRQPQWDAIGKTKDDAIILVEAKAHIGETRSKCRASDNSKLIIQKSLETLHKELSVKKSFDENIWMNKHYQTANRLLFWYNINKKCNATLVFLNFVNAEHLPTSEQEWEKHSGNVINDLLGCEISSLPSGIKFIIYDVHKV